MITGEKVYLKGITKEDSAKIYNWVNQEKLRDYTGTIFPISEYEHEKWIVNQATSSDKKLFVICCLKSHREIGTIGLKAFDWINRNAELFISIGEMEEYTSKGYGCDAVKTFVKYCFDKLNLHKVYLQVFESNVRAIKCYEKAGFQKEGVLREQHFSKGCYEDIIFMSKISHK